MEWRIELPSEEKNTVVKLGQKVPVLRCAEASKPICTAIAVDAYPQRLALVLDSRLGVNFKGREVLSPVIAVDSHGGEVTIKRGAKLFRLRISLCRSGDFCYLCRSVLEDNWETMSCPKCQAIFHRECILGEEKCPICLGRFDEIRKERM